MKLARMKISRHELSLGVNVPDTVTLIFISKNRALAAAFGPNNARAQQLNNKILIINEK